MAMHGGMPCLECEQRPSRKGSHYCSAACEAAFMAANDGPVECEECFYGTDTVAEAQAAGWVDVTPDPEGLSWNYMGLCPECQADLSLTIVTENSGERTDP